VFVLLTEEAWSNVYYEYHRACGSFRANLYFLSLFIIGPRILLNLFLCILLQNFEEDKLETEGKIFHKYKISIIDEPEEFADESDMTFLDRGIRFMK
jgi:Ion transport protein